MKQSIKRKIDLVSRKMLSGKIPMPESSLAIMGADPVAFFNRLRKDDSGYSFAEAERITGPVCRLPYSTMSKKSTSRSQKWVNL